MFRVRVLRSLQVRVHVADERVSIHLLLLLVCIETLLLIDAIVMLLLLLIEIAAESCRCRRLRRRNSDKVRRGRVHVVVERMLVELQRESRACC